MPCSKGMAQCRRNCLHRRMVEDYRAWREAAEQARETATRGYRTEMTEYGPLPTYREWLETMKGSAA